MCIWTIKRTFHGKNVSQESLARAQPATVCVRNNVSTWVQWKIPQVSMILNSIISSTGTSLMGVSVHEFGHSLGLGHSSVEDAIMFPWYHGYQKFENLPKDDWLAIQQLYGKHRDCPSEKSFGVNFVLLLDSGRKQWDDNPHRKTTTSTRATTTTTTTTTTRRPYETDRRHNPHRHNTNTPTHRSKHYPHDKPYNPKRDYDHRVFTERTDVDMPKRPYKPYYPRFPATNPDPTDYPRYYPDRPRPYSTTTTTQRPFRHHPHKDKPETCNTSYDAITIIRGELFIFKDRVSWIDGSRF